MQLITAILCYYDANIQEQINNMQIFESLFFKYFIIN